MTQNKNFCVVTGLNILTTVGTVGQCKLPNVIYIPNLRKISKKLRKLKQKY